jgi:hypothetical protein
MGVKGEAATFFLSEWTADSQMVGIMLATSRKKTIETRGSTLMKGRVNYAVQDSCTGLLHSS